MRLITPLPGHRALSSRVGGRIVEQGPKGDVLAHAGARHLVLGPIGAPSLQWVADEIVRPVLSTPASHR